MVIIQFFGINLTVANYFDLVFFVIALIELYSYFHSLLFYGILI